MHGQRPEEPETSSVFPFRQSSAVVRAEPAGGDPSGLEVCLGRPGLAMVSMGFWASLGRPEPAHTGTGHFWGAPMPTQGGSERHGWGGAGVVQAELSLDTGQTCQASKALVGLTWFGSGGLRLSEIGLVIRCPPRGALAFRGCVTWLQGVGDLCGPHTHTQRTGSDAGWASWRPAKRHRIGAKHFILNIDNQVGCRQWGSQLWVRNCSPTMAHSQPCFLPLPHLDIVSGYPLDSFSALARHRPRWRRRPRCPGSATSRCLSRTSGRAGGRDGPRGHT